jgi:hypothetical protein
MGQKFSSKNVQYVQYLLVVVLIAGILPFLFNSLFDNPWTDDFCYSAMARLRGFWPAQIYWYKFWTGRYFSTALLSVNPLVFGHIWGYKLIPLALVLSLLFSLYFLTDEITAESLRFREKLIFTLMLSFAYFDQMPDVRPGLYWMAGTLTYQASAILLFIFVFVISSIRRLPEKNEILFKIIAAILAVCLPGTNELVLALLFPAFSLFIFLDYRKQHKINPFFVAIFVIVTICTCLSFFAPGNSVRLAQYKEGQSLLFSVKLSLLTTLKSLSVWATTPFVLIMTLVIMLYVCNNSRLVSVWRQVSPFFSLMLLFVTMFISYFTTFWGTGMFPQERVVNLIYLFFLIGWFLNVLIVSTRLNSCFFACLKRIPVKVILFLTVPYLIALFSIGSSNFVLVAGDLIHGTAYRYNKELQQRYARIWADPSPVCQVEVLRNTPRSLFPSDIGYVNEGWINESYAAYFGKRSIALKKERELR